MIKQNESMIALREDMQEKYLHLDAFCGGGVVREAKNTLLPERVLC